MCRHYGTPLEIRMWPAGIVRKAFDAGLLFHTTCLKSLHGLCGRPANTEEDTVTPRRQESGLRTISTGYPPPPFHSHDFIFLLYHLLYSVPRIRLTLRNPPFLLDHSLTHSPTYPLFHPLSRPLTQSFSHPLTRSGSL